MFLSHSPTAKSLNIKAIETLNIYFALFSVSPLPKDWTEIATDIKSGNKVSIQFFKQGSLVTELVPFLVYNVHQAFKYHYNSLKGFEQELLIALYGKRSFQEALSNIGVSACDKAVVLLLSETVEELEKAIEVLKKKVSEAGSNIEPFENDEDLFASFWRLLFTRLGFGAMGMDYHQILEFVKERIAISYL